MSGGSFNYLCSVDVNEVQARFCDLEDMRKALVEVGAVDAAAETEDLIATMRQFEVLAGVRIDRLRGVWRAMEWWRSGDLGPDDVAAALAEYRKGMR